MPDDEDDEDMNDAEGNGSIGTSEASQLLENAKIASEKGEVVYTVNYNEVHGGACSRVAGISLAAHMSVRALRDECVSAASGLHRSISFPRRLTHSRSSRIGIYRALAFDSRASQVVARSSTQRATAATSVASLRGRRRARCECRVCGG